MKQLTKKDRRRIYEQVLGCDFTHPCNGSRVGMCRMIYEVTGDHSVYNGMIHFYELAAQKPKGADGYWFVKNESGNAKRRAALEKAILLTYKK